MSSKKPTLEELKKQAAEKAAAEAAELERKRPLMTYEDMPHQAHPEVEEVSFASATPSYEAGWMRVVEAYEIYAKENDIKGSDKKNGLVFPSHDAAITFFEKQAVVQNLPFCATKYENGKPAEPEFHVFSCGNYTLYQGTYASILKDLSEAAKTDPIAKAGLEKFKSLESKLSRTPPSAAPSPAADLRNQLLAEKTAMEQQQQRQDPAPPAASSLPRLK